VPELRAETRTSASRLEAYLQAVPRGQFPVKHISLSSQLVKLDTEAHDNVSDNSGRNGYAEAGFIPIFGDGMGIVPCPETTVAGIKNTII
jgi:hypothetical protein